MNPKFNENEMEIHYCDAYVRSVRLSYIEARRILREAGEKLGDGDVINTAQEKKLGRMVKEHYHTDDFSVHRCLPPRIPNPKPKP
jgi:hypothetical protein